MSGWICTENGAGNVIFRTGPITITGDGTQGFLMKRPRRPRGEKPAATIRYQRKQIDFLAGRIGDLCEKLAVAERSLHEAQDRANGMEAEADFLTEQLTNARADQDAMESELARQDLRLHFLEGYYQAQQEHRNAVSPVAHRREGEADQDYPPSGDGHVQAARPHAAVRGIHQAPGGTVRGFTPNRASRGQGATVQIRTGTPGTAQEEAAIYEVGEARDGQVPAQRVNRTYPLPDGPLYRR